MIIYIQYALRDRRLSMPVTCTDRVSTSAAAIQDRPARPLAAACCAPLLREPITAGQAADLAHKLKALADPTRLRLVSMFAAHDGGEACVCDLVSYVPCVLKPSLTVRRGRRPRVA